MGFYDTYILPYATHLAMNRKDLAAERATFVPLARGRVLEIGIGSGLNLPFYGAQVEHLFALDPSAELKRMAEKRARGVAFPVEFIGLSGEDIPLDDGAVDCVLTTWTLCTIPDAGAALGEMRRVLKPDGELVFVEHGRSPDARVLAWQNRLNPLWRPIAGGCNLNRAIDALIGEAGFNITRMEQGYMKGPKPMTYLYKGTASK
jgi:ubiquinone/menaquinone biosynthesis C-methylase UbiE